MRWISALIAVLMAGCISAGTTGANGGLIFVFYPEVSISGEELTVADLGRVVGSQKAGTAVGSLMKASLGKEVTALLFGQLEVKRNLLESTVSRYFSARGISVRFSGPLHIQLKPSLATRSDAEVITAARSYLETMLPDCVAVESIDYAGSHALQIPAQGKLDFTMPEPVNLRRIAVWANHETAGRYTLWFELTGSYNGWVMTESVGHGDIVDVNHMVQRSIALETLTEMPFLGEPAWQKSRYRVSARNGRLVTKDLLQPLPAVIAGETVKVRSRIGSVVIYGAAEAVGEADIGGTVMLRSLSSDEIYSAYVTGYGSAEVAESLAFGRQPL